MKIQLKLLWLALAQVVYCSNAQTNTDLIMESFGLSSRTHFDPRIEWKAPVIPHHVVRPNPFGQIKFIGFDGAGLGIDWCYELSTNWTTIYSEPMTDGTALCRQAGQPISNTFVLLVWHDKTNRVDVSTNALQVDVLPQRLVTNSTVFYFNDFNNIFGTRGLTNL